MVYLIHLERKLSHAQHYIGFCNEGMLVHRFKHHIHGNGSRFLAAVAKAGIKFLVVRTWSGEGRDFERRLKKGHSSKSLCPICITKAQVDSLWESTNYTNAQLVEKSQTKNVESTHLVESVYSVEGV